MDKNELRKYAGLPLDESVSKAGTLGVRARAPIDGVRNFGGTAELRISNEPGDWRGSLQLDGSGEFGKDFREARFDNVRFRVEKNLKKARTSEADIKVTNQKIKLLEKLAKKFQADVRKILEK